MALWGTADAVYATGTITVNLSDETITGSGTTFTNAAVGDVISIASTQFIRPDGGAAIAGVAYTISQKPKYTLEDGQYTAPDVKSNRFSAVFGIDPYEVGVAATTNYAVAHAGWVGITTYNDMHGTLRIKSEVLVAMSGISSGTPAAGVDGDAGDDSFGTFVYKP